jgi:cytoskeletal protein CcmA (bactofilin family)
VTNLFRKSAEETNLIQKNEIGSIENNESGKERNMGEGNVTNLTSDVEINGTIKFDKVMRIDGKFEGEMTTTNGELIVGKTGSIKATVKVKNAVVEGRVEGNITATEKIEFKQKAQLIGDLQAKTLVIEEGVVFVGNCNVNPEGTKVLNQSLLKEVRKEEKRL